MYINKASDFRTSIVNSEDRDMLTRRLFDVNMRLFQRNPHYRGIVLMVCGYIHSSCQMHREGRKQPKGVSGANRGLPFNIIAYHNAKDECHVMINPVITRWYGKRLKVYTKCGALKLKQPVPVSRWERIDVTFFDIDGKKQTFINVTREMGGYTIQHEVEHNLGVIITDYQVSQ